MTSLRARGTAVSRTGPNGSPRRRLLMAFAAALAALVPLVAAVPAGPALANTRDDKNHADAKAAATAADLEDVSTELAQAYLALSATQAKLPGAQAALTTARSNEAAAKKHLDEVNTALNVAKANLQRGKEQLAATQKSIAATQSSLNAFAAAVFQGGGTSQVSVAFGATSPDDFASRIVMADTVTTLTNRALGDLSTAKADAQAQKAYLDAVQERVTVLQQEATAALGAAKAATTAATAAKAALDALLAQQTTQAAALDAQKAGLQAQLAADQAEQARLQAVLEDEARRAAAEEAARRAAQGNSYRPVTGGSGFLSMPANGPISSPFGTRFHPILHVWKLHSGTDFAIACGTPVHAAADGTVISAGWGGGDGNRIVVSHGIVNGVSLASTYNHLSKFVVTGGHVSRGQLIGYSGTTGYSTGCHLHFETLENGQFVNPMKWL